MHEADGGPVARLGVGFVAGVTLTRWRRVWAERHPELPLSVAEVAAWRQRHVLETGELDLCFVRLPLGPGAAEVEEDGLQLVRLYTEVPVVVVPRDHPASLFESVTLADLQDENLLDAEPVPSSSADRSDSLDSPDPFDLVAAGAGVLLVPHAVARAQSRRDVVARPVSDAEPTEVALAWWRDREHPATQDFVGVVRGRTPHSSRSAPPPDQPRRDDRPPRRRGEPPSGRRPVRRRGHR